MQAVNVNCPGCGAENKPGAQFCRSCGRPMPKTQAAQSAVAGGACPGCGADNQPGAKYCRACGRPMPGSAPAYVPPASPVRQKSGGRKPLVITVTALVLAAALVVGLWKPGLVWQWSGRNQSGLLGELTGTLQIGEESRINSGTAAPAGPGALVEAETQSETVSPDSAVVTLSGATVDFCGTINLEGEARASVSRMEPEQHEDGASTRTIYDITLEGRSEFAVPLQITLPYDPALCVPGNEAGSVTAQYYNPDTAEWEPMFFAQVDTEAKTVSFLTSHLSLYAVYQFRDLYTERATISHLAPNLDIGNAMAILEEYADNGAPGPLAKASFGEMVAEFFTKGTFQKDAPGYGKLQDQSAEAMVDTAYGSVVAAVSVYEKTKHLGEMYENCGLALAGIRAVIAAAEGRHRDAAFTAYGAVYNRLASLALGSAFSIASVAVIPIKYAIQGVQEEAVSANLRGTENAYRAYYKTAEGDYVRTNDDWVKLFIDLYMKQWQSGTPSADRLAEEFDEILESYIMEFWHLDDFEKALEGKLGGNDTWVHPDFVEASERDKMIRNFRNALHERINLDIMPILERFMQEKAQEELKKPLLEYMRVMNAVITVTLDENIPVGSFEEPKYHGYYLRYEYDTPGSDADFRTTQLPDEGSAYQLPWFTVLGYAMHGFPSHIRLYKNLDDLKLGKAALDIPLKITSRDVWINIGSDELTFEDILGSYATTTIISNYSMGMLDDIVAQMPPELAEYYDQYNSFSASMNGSHPGELTIERTGDNTCTFKMNGDSFGAGSYDIVYGDGSVTTESYDYTGMLPYYDGTWNQESCTLSLVTQGSPLNVDMTVQFSKEEASIRFTGSGSVKTDTISYDYILQGTKGK